MYPDGNSQFFQVPHRTSKTFSVPSFNSDEKYKIAFCGAVSDGNIEDSTEVKYSLNVGGRAPVFDEKLTFNRTMRMFGESRDDITNHGNDDENHAYIISPNTPIYAYSSAADIDFYEIDFNVTQAGIDVNYSFNATAPSGALTVTNLENGAIQYSAPTGYSSYSWYIETSSGIQKIDTDESVVTFNPTTDKETFGIGKWQIVCVTEDADFSAYIDLQ